MLNTFYNAGLNQKRKLTPPQILQKIITARIQDFQFSVAASMNISKKLILKKLEPVEQSFAEVQF